MLCHAKQIKENKNMPVCVGMQNHITSYRYLIKEYIATYGDCFSLNLLNGVCECVGTNFQFALPITILRIYYIGKHA